MVGSILQLWPQTACFLLGVSLFLDVFSLKLLGHFRGLEPKAMSNILFFFWITTLSKSFNWDVAPKMILRRYFMERRNLAIAVSVSWELGERDREISLSPILCQGTRFGKAIIWKLI